MTRGMFAILLMVLSAFACTRMAEAQLVPQKLEPHPLPAKVLEGLTKLAAESDVLVLGETHGTQETPAVALALLAPLDKLGYGALALEIPAHEQQPLEDWATGKTETVPLFFAKPFDDGRGNIQALALIRMALSAPLGWQLICFDEPWDFQLNEKRNADEAKGEEDSQLEDAAADWVRRDAAMAALLARERAKVGGGGKVLAICGSFHARTSRDIFEQRSMPPPHDFVVPMVEPGRVFSFARCRPSSRTVNLTSRLYSRYQGAGSGRHRA